VNRHPWNSTKKQHKSRIPIIVSADTHTLTHTQLRSPGKTVTGNTRDRLRRPYYLSRVDHFRKIWDRKQRTDIGKYSIVNWTIRNWNQLPAQALGTFLWKPKIFRKRVRNYKRGEMKGIEVWWKSSKSAVKWSDVKWSEVKWSEVKWSEVKWSDVMWDEMER
jgi:hypothetical protein